MGVMKVGEGIYIRSSMKYMYKSMLFWKKIGVIIVTKKKKYVKLMHSSLISV